LERSEDGGTGMKPRLSERTSNLSMALAAVALCGCLVAILATSVASQSDDALPGYISGVVESSEGAEAGVWVIAETDDLPTHLIKIVVTDGEGRFVLPELPDGLYDVWVRGYGLVDSSPVAARPGADLALTATLARTPQEAARVYPANYWYSLLEVPDESEFPGTGEEGNGISEGMRSQKQWLDMTKQGCQLCHQLGNQVTREITHLSYLGFDSSSEAWDHRVQVVVRGGFMSGFMNRYGRQRAVEMYADWTDRIAAGEVPTEAPPRPSGQERNVVVTLWDWGNETSYIHDEITTDKWNPTLNAGGPVYGVDGGHGALLELDPATNTWRSIEIPVLDLQENAATSRFPQRFPKPSPFYGDEALWEKPADPHNPMFDDKGRVWMTTKVRGNTLPTWCQEGLRTSSRSTTRHAAALDRRRITTRPPGNSA